MASTWADTWGKIDWEHVTVAEIESMIASYSDCLDLQDENGKSGLYLSVLYSKLDILKKLLEKGAKTEQGTDLSSAPVAVAETDKLPSPLAMAFREGDEAAAKLLIENGANYVVSAHSKWNAEQKAKFEETKKNIWTKVDMNELAKNGGLEKALERGDKPMVRILALRGAKLNEWTDGKPSALAMTIKNKDFETFNYIATVSKDAIDWNKFDPANGGDTLLNEAIKGLPDPVYAKFVRNMLLRGGVDINLEGKDGKRPWTLLCERMENATTPQEKEIIREISTQMMAKGMTMENGQEPVEAFKHEYAQDIDDVDFKKLNRLIEMGTVIDANKKQGAFDPVYNIPLDVLNDFENSGIDGRKETVKKWIEQDLPITPEGKSASIVCFEAVAAQDKNLVENFMRLRVNPNAQNANGDSLLMVNMENANKDIGEMLVAAGAKVDEPRNKNGQTALMQSIIHRKDKTYTDWLADHSDNLDAQDKDLFTALHYAVANSDKQMVEKLLAKGVLVDAQTKDGNTALHLAVRKGNAEIAKMLINNGADVTIQNAKNNSPLSLGADFCVNPNLMEELNKAVNDRKDRVLDVKWTRISSKYGVILGAPIKCGGKMYDKTCRVIANMFRSNDNGR
ncbi:MAG: ankyrin repeat domain-containing protein [Alphaproteobacteria bacterium]